MLKDKNKKNQFKKNISKKKPKSTRVNFTNPPNKI